MCLRQLLASTDSSIFLYLYISILPPIATFMFFWGLEYWKKIPLADQLWFSIVVISGSYAIFFPPELPGCVSIICGPGCVIHIVRAVELGFVLDVPTLRRLRRTQASNDVAYMWETYPPPLTLRRGIWLIDLMTSIRGIGWTHGPRACLPPASLLFETQSGSQQQQKTKIGGRNERSQKIDREKFLIQKGIELFVCYLWIDFYQSIIICSEGWDAIAKTSSWDYPETTQKIVSWLLTPFIKWIPVKMSIYAVIQIACSFLAFVDLGLGFSGNEHWQYPPIFGPSTGLINLNFQGE